MALIFKSEPAGVAEVVWKGLKKMGKTTPKTGRDAQTDSALPIYNLGLDYLKEGRDLSASMQVGWRYLLRHDGEVPASADAVSEIDGEPIFTQVIEGPLVQGIFSAIEVAKSEKGLIEKEYEVRLLIVPALQFAALWLVDIREGLDVAIPIEPAPLLLTPNRPIPTKELLDVLQKAAIESLAALPPER